MFKPPRTKLFKIYHCAGFETRAAPQKEARVNKSSITSITDREGDAALKVREIITWLTRQYGWQEMPSITPQGLMQRDMFIDWAFSSSASSCFIIYGSALRLLERSWGILKSRRWGFLGENTLYNLDPALTMLHIPTWAAVSAAVTGWAGCDPDRWVTDPTAPAQALVLSLIPVIVDKMKPTRDHLVIGVTKLTSTVKIFS